MRSSLQHALDDAILAARPVQGVERDIGREPRQHLGDVAADVDAGNLETFGFERLGAGFPRTQADAALAGEAAHQNRDVLGHFSSSQ